MATGDRTKKGKPSDFQIHFRTLSKIVLCGRYNWMISSYDPSEITCKACLKQLEKLIHKQQNKVQ